MPFEIVLSTLRLMNIGFADAFQWLAKPLFPVLVGVPYLNGQSSPMPG
jgi:hypothetical protein